MTTNDNTTPPTPEAVVLTTGDDCRLRAAGLDASAAAATTEIQRTELQLLAAEWRRLGVVADWQESLIHLIDES